MSCTIKPVFKALSIANGCPFSLPALFSTKTSLPYLPIPLPSQPIKLHLSFSISSSPTSSFAINKTTHTSTVAAFAAQIDWAQQGTNTAVTEDEDEEPRVDAIGDAGEGGGEVGFEEGEESYPEPPEEAKVYVGNLDYGVDSETLAQVFEQAGVVEIAEVKYNRQTDQSQGYAFVTMRTVEEADKAIELFHRYEKHQNRSFLDAIKKRFKGPHHPDKNGFSKIYNSLGKQGTIQISLYSNSSSL